MRHRTHTRPVPRNQYPVPWRNDPRPTPVWTDAHLSFGMPASFEDMVALGLDPYTGEVA